MASSPALKKLFSASSLRPLRSDVPAASSRLFNTNVAANRYEDDDDEDVVDVDRRYVSPGYYYSEFAPFTDVFAPYPSSRSLGQIMNIVKELSADPGSKVASGLPRFAKETDDGVHIHLDLPGFSKEDVKVSVEQNTLVIKGETPKSGAEEEDGGRKVSRKIDLPEKRFKTDNIKAELKNGVLKLFVPKMKNEERTDVFHVEVQ